MNELVLKHVGNFIIEFLLRDEVVVDSMCLFGPDGTRGKT